MEETTPPPPPPKKGRKRSRSLSQTEAAEKEEARPESAPDLNGDTKPAAKPAEEKAEESRRPEGGEGEEPKRGRKRKASEARYDSAEEVAELEEKPEVKGEGDDEGKAEEKEKEATADPAGKEETFDEAQLKDEPSSPSQDSKDIRLPPKQTLGKGKRARIPNKRYSDILISPRQNNTPDSVKTTKKNSAENGLPQDVREKENVDTEGTPETKVDAATTVRASRSAQSSPAQPVSKKAKPSVDLSNPNFLKPFKYGWKRELVYRATSDSPLRRNGDIYYYTPSGKKVRSMREVAENLKNKELTLDNFTFFKEPLGLDDPEKEIIRDAKYKAGPGGVEEKSAVQAAPKKGPAKAIKGAPPKGASSPKPTAEKEEKPTAGAQPAEAAATAAPAAPAKGKSSPKSGKALKIKLPNTRGQSKQAKQEKKPPAVATTAAATGKDEEMDVGTYPPNWQSPKRTPKWNNNGGGGTSEVAAPAPAETNKPCRPCSIRCRGVVGLVPTLQCRVCLCLYHNECVGVAPHLQVQAYECKNCQLEQDPSTVSTPTIQPPPPLTPISSLISQTNMANVAAGAAAAAPLPKLQRIPRADETDAKVRRLNSPATPESKGLVGGVTTWFPPSSTIQVGGGQMRPPQLGLVHAPRPQFVEFLGDRKFLIIPKHNILSVSPSPSRSEENVKVAQKEPDPPDPASLGPDLKDRKAPLLEEQRGEEVATNESEGAKGKRSSARITNATATSPKIEQARYMDNFLQHLAVGYNTLLYVFQYLKVQDLLRAGCVCQMWHDVASHPSLWKTVRMKNSQVHSFEGLADTLKKHNTVHLDLRKMLLPNGDEIWPSFSQAIRKVDSLRRIELCRCPASVVEQLPISNPDLEVVNAVTIRCETMSLAPFGALKDLQELRLKSTAGLNLTSDLSALTELTKLKHLSLTSIKDLNKLNIEVIAELKNLESLDLGECTDFSKSFGVDILTKLEKLEKLRLEKGQGNCYTFEILEAVKNMPRLEQLELVNFDIKNGFDLALGACTNIKKLLVIPTYISQSATTNHMVLGGVLRLRSTLSHFVWGVTLELLRVTELFVDQCEEPEKKEKKDKRAASSGDSIPVLKPVPLIKDNDTVILPAHDPPQVEILPLQNLQKLLLQSLPTTRVKILKIPFHATWRQSITDTVN